MVERHSSILDRKVSRVCGYPLTIQQQKWLHFIFPGVSLCILYVLNLSLEFGIGLDLLNQMKWKSSLATISIMYLPASVIYLREIVIPPNPRDAKITSIWILKETGFLVFFPYRITKCLGEQMFWIVEILKNNANEEDALCGYEESFSEPAQTYMFVMIFLQNIPQAVLQLYLLTIGISSNTETDIVQAFCAVISVAMAAVGVMTYHRYESQRLGGRTSVWSRETDSRETSETENTTSLIGNPLLQDYLVPKSSTELNLPVRRPRSRALEEDNPVGKLILFLFWFLFLFGRILTIVITFTFYPKTVAALLSAHTILMFLYYTWYPIKLIKKICLSFTSLFIIIEVGIQFRKTVYLYMVFIISTLVEDIGMTIIWFVWGDWDGWWYSYAVYVNINAHFLSLISFACYLAFFRPKIKYVNRVKT